MKPQKRATAPGTGESEPSALAAPWVARSGRAFQILGLLLLPGLFLKYAHGNVAINDFSVYYTAARSLLEGADPYAIEGPTGRPFVYPPGFAVLLTPLALLPFPVAAVLWSVLSLAAIVASVWLCLDLLGVARGPAAWTLGGLALLCSGRMLDSELGNGQANHWVLLGIVASTWCVARGRAALGGFLLAFAIVAKLTPLLLVGYFAARRQFRACAGAAAGLALLAGMLPVLAFGPGGAFDANRVWARAVVRPALPGITRPAAKLSSSPRRVHGHSLRALVHHHLTRTHAAEQYDEAVFVNSVAWSPRTAESIYHAAALLLLALTAIALGARAPRDPPRWLLEVACVAMLMVLIAPLSRKAHFVVLLPPFAYAVTRAVANRSRAAVAWVVPPALVFALTSKNVIGDHAAALALAWGAYTLATLWLWAGAVIVCGRDRRLG